MAIDRTAAENSRSERTRTAIIAALVGLLMQRRYPQIRIADIIVAANVGRSTFYDHFASKDAVLIASFEPILLPLANAASDRVSEAAMAVMLDHVWDRRDLARTIFRAAVADKLALALAARINGRLAMSHGDHPSHSLTAQGAAAGQLAILKMWVNGTTNMTRKVIARALMAYGRLSEPG